MHRSLILVSLLASLLAVPAIAAAQVGGPDLRIGAGLVLDFGGEVELDYGGPGDPEDDLELTPGFRVHLDYDVAQYVSVGGFARFSWWEGDDFAQDRSFLFDLGPRVAGHYDWRDFRFYLAFMPGLTISAVDDDSLGGLDNPGVGLAVALAPGVEYWFSQDFGLFVEIFGWSGHYFGHDLDNNRGDIDVSMNQVLWQLGINFAP